MLDRCYHELHCLQSIPSTNVTLIVFLFYSTWPTTLRSHQFVHHNFPGKWRIQRPYDLLEGKINSIVPYEKNLLLTVVALEIFSILCYFHCFDILQEIQKQRIYGSHLRYVVSVCPYNTSQEPRDCTEETVFNFARFQIPAQQEITTRIWSKNEIGTSRDFALIRIPSKDECKHVVLLKFVNIFY